MYVLCYSKSDEDNIKKLFPEYKNIVTLQITESFCLKHQILNIFDPIAKEFDNQYFLGEEKTKEF